MNFMNFMTMTSLMLIFSLFNFSCGNGDTNGKEMTKADSSAADSVKSDDEKMKAEEEKKKKEKEADLIPVEVTTINKGSISDYILLSSNLETERMADVYSRVQGLVEKIYVEEADYVKKGQILMSLEADEYKLAEEKAKLITLQQKSDFDRFEAMYKQNLLSKEEFEKAKFTLQSLEVDWKTAKLNLSYTRITASIAGVIGDRFRKPGDRIQPTDKLFTVINTNEMIAVVYAPEKEIGNVEKNQKAYITSDHLAGKEYKGWVKRVSPVVDPQSGTFKITVGVKNENNKLRAGMFVNTHIITSTHDNTILIPKMAIVYENERMNVFVVRDSIANKVLLKAGFQDHEKVESLDGIEEGDQIIIIGQAGLKDKTKVRVVNVRENSLIYLQRSED